MMIRLTIALVVMLALLMMIYENMVMVCEGLRTSLTREWGLFDTGRTAFAEFIVLYIIKAVAIRS